MIPAVKINSFLIDQSDPWSLRRQIRPLSKANNKTTMAMLTTPPQKTKMSLGNKLILHRRRPTVGIQNKAVRNIKTRRRPYCFDVVSNHLRDFMTSSSMHGLKYAAEKEASWIERFLWIALFAACFTTSVVFIVRMWFKWENSPVLISVDSTDHPNSLIDFPAVSVCNVNQAFEAAILDELTIPFYQNMTRADFLLLLAASVTGVNPEEEVRLRELEIMLHSDRLKIANGTNFMKRVAQPCSRMLLFCEWQTEPINCSEMFSLVPSNQGFCCVYNLIAKQTHQQQHGNNSRNNHNNDQDKQPLRAYGEGVHMGLTLLLDAEISEWALPSSAFYGFKVLIHHPEDQPDPSAKGFAVSPGSEVFAGVSTSSIFGTEGVRHLSPDARNCRYSHENNLEYFTRYSQSNCYMERMANTIVQQCHCLPFYFLIGDEATPMCSFTKIACLKEALNNFHRNRENKCLANCNATSYFADLSYGTFPNEGFRNSRIVRFIDSKHFTNSYLQKNAALLHVFFRDRSGIRYRRDVRYDWQDFVSAVGGLLGLGVGLSLLSVLEILYFCGLRSCLRQRRTPPAAPPLVPVPAAEFSEFSLTRSLRHPVQRFRLYY